MAGDPEPDAGADERGRRWLRRAAVAALCAWSAGLLLAAAPLPARRGWLATPSAAAGSLLRSLGMRAGVLVFLPERERIVRLVRNDCLRVRALRPDGATTLHPTSGRCFVAGVRARVPRDELALRMLHVRAPSPLNQAVVGDHYCHAAGGPVPEQVEVAWTRPWRDLDSGELGVEAVALYRWRCEPPGLAAELRAPALHEIPAVGPELEP